MLPPFQRLSVSYVLKGIKYKPAYDTITMGAPAAHTMQFKKGGLKRQLEGAQSCDLKLRNFQSTATQKLRQAMADLAICEKHIHGSLVSRRFLAGRLALPCAHLLFPPQAVVEQVIGLEDDEQRKSRLNDLKESFPAEVKELVDFIGSPVFSESIRKAKAAQPARSVHKTKGVRHQGFQMSSGPAFACVWFGCACVSGEGGMLCILSLTLPVLF